MSELNDFIEGQKDAKAAHRGIDDCSNHKQSQEKSESYLAGYGFEYEMQERKSAGCSN